MNRPPLATRSVSIVLVALAAAPLACSPAGESSQSVGAAPAPMTPQDRVTYGKYEPDAMTAQERAETGEILVFGRLTGGRPTEGDVGKSLCPLCHTVVGPPLRAAAPDLTAGDARTQAPIARRAEQRVEEERYRRANFVQVEAAPGTGRATTGLEYIVESHVCPSCYVVEGFGKPGTADRESPMVPMHLPPACQTVEEEIMITTYLYVKDGLEPPAPDAIRAAYRKFLPSVKAARGC